MMNPSSPPATKRNTALLLVLLGVAVAFFAGIILKTWLFGK